MTSAEGQPTISASQPAPGLHQNFGAQERLWASPNEPYAELIPFAPGTDK